MEFRKAIKSEADLLADIRADAMKPSLETLGRFDRNRARQRFLATFIADETQVIIKDTEIVGFFVLRFKENYVWFDHLYLKSSAQGLGLGQSVVRSVQKNATKTQMPIRLMALMDSPANAFYISLGFKFTRREGVDNHYEWSGEKTD